MHTKDSAVCVCERTVEVVMTNREVRNKSLFRAFSCYSFVFCISFSTAPFLRGIPIVQCYLLRVIAAAVKTQRTKDVPHYRETRSIHTFKIDLNWKMAMRWSAHLKFKCEQLSPSTKNGGRRQCSVFAGWCRWFNHSISIYIFNMGINPI